MARGDPVVRVLLFAMAREAVGRSAIDWPVPPGGVRARALLTGLAARYSKLRSILSSSRFVRNGRYLDDLDTPLKPGDEFAVHPPYGGG